MIEFIKKYKKVIIIVASVICCVLFFVVGTVSAVKAKSNKYVDTSSKIDRQQVVSEVVTSEEISVSSKVESDTNTDSESNVDEVIKPIDCQQDFWAVKYGIAECYDHIFKKGHMEGKIYYQGDCDRHDAVEINELARKVKLYRDDDDGKYTAILPEIGWVISIYDEKIQKIIDAQIQGSGEVYPFEEISIVMYYSSNDNSITIETVEEE